MIPHRFIIALALLTMSAAVAHADVTVPKIIDSHMVLQRDLPVPVWGWAEAGEEVEVQFGNQKVSTKADDQGRWSVTLKPMKASARPRSMTIKGKNTIKLDDILVGEVWVGSGQSNMEWTLSNSQDGSKAISKANFPAVRLFHVPKVKAPTPARDVKAAWKVCTPASVPNFSGVLFFFGRTIHIELRVPIGLINSSWGGSPIEPWTVTEGGSGDMYNGMIAPVKPFAIRGALWYQGETNVIHKNGFAYADKMKALIEGWRRVWSLDFPFYFVQIAPWSGGRYEPGQLPALWEAQVATLKLPRTGMVVTTDLVDNINDIHPRNKLDVGTRLARWALAKDYGKKSLVYSGPLYTSMKVEGSSIRLSFAHADSGLRSRDGKPLSEFQIAGEDGKYVPAEAKITGKTLVVSSKDVAAPRHIRFGWHKTANPNLVNRHGLPASPFQTDNWRGGTGE